jgi:hypothetical protein
MLNLPPLMDHYLKEEDVLHCLHLLAYLSKYPHVRAVFHDPVNEICAIPSSETSTTEATESLDTTNNATSKLSASTTAAAIASSKKACCSCARKKARFGAAEAGGEGSASGSASDSGNANGVDENLRPASSSASAASLSGNEDNAAAPAAATAASASEVACNGQCHAHADEESKNVQQGHRRTASSGSQKHSHPCCDDDEEAESLARARAMATMPAKDRKPALEPSRPPRSTAHNIFSLVEQYTFRPSSPADRSMRLGTDIQYWAGVIMRNACRKDELRGGIRQCANMGCGVWERFPREFAKCRRCRKAKYCSKGCQRRAWQAGHR